MTDLCSSRDFRRAAVLILHAAVQDDDGMKAIWDEAATDNSWPDLTAAVLAVVFEVVPQLRSPEGVVALRAFVAEMVRLESPDD